jgi:RNA polymerase sigma-70 factor (ECF subfamily)
MARREPRSQDPAPADTERLLIEAAQKDPARFAELYEINFGRVYAFIARRVRDRSEIEDLTSDVFHQALAALPRFEWRGAPFAAWLFKIAANTIIDRSNKAAKEKTLRSPSNYIEVSEEVRPLELEEIEQRDTLFELVERLPEDQRRVILLRFAEEKSIRDVAETLSRSEGAVKQLQFRALQNLRTMEFEKSSKLKRKRTESING